ncbi:MAG: bifunctional nuclease family protein [Candidatus Caenarcaniphilales bacterium]|nr:bifunctional nuclease family protein [Candidatus Caenarcaniphilales bacterium]
MLEFKVTGLGIDTRTDQPLVILNSLTEDDLILPIWIGRLEAQSIAIALQGDKPERPLTHDLMLSAIESSDCRLDKVEIHSVFNGTFFAHLYLKRIGSEEEIILDARPSDCIALALRSQCLIFISESVREQSCIPAIIRNATAAETDEQESENEKEEFRRFLDNVKASDFKLPPDDAGSKS